MITSIIKFFSSIFSSKKTSGKSVSLVPETWRRIRLSGLRMKETEPFLSGFSHDVVLAHEEMADGLAHLLSRQNLDPLVSCERLVELFLSIYVVSPALVEMAAKDLNAVIERDPAATDMLIPFLHFKGFAALQTHRAAHWLWGQGRKDMALFLQNRASVLYGVDIHPAARMGSGIMLDHATGIVIGETAVVEDNVSMLHAVTLGGTGKEKGDRHPKVRRGVMIGAGAKILGNVEIGIGASIAAGSVVLQSVPAHVTVAGVPAKIVGKPKVDEPAVEMDQSIPEV